MDLKYEGRSVSDDVMPAADGYSTFFFFFITLGLELGDTNVYEP